LPLGFVPDDVIETFLRPDLALLLDDFIDLMGRAAFDAFQDLSESERPKSRKIACA
jgi:hypothetical protein